MRVLLLRSSRGFFGAERVVLDLARNLPATGFDPCVACLDDAREPHLELVTRASEAGIDTLTFPIRGRVDVGAIRAIARALLDGAFDLLHVHDYKTQFLGLAAARLARRPVVATLHGETGESAAVRLYESAARPTLRLLDGVVAVSATLLAIARRWGPRGGATHISNGIDAEAVSAAVEAAEPHAAAAGSVDGAPVILSLGRLSKEKGHHHLIEAVAGLEGVRPRLIIAGDGVEREALALRGEAVGVDLVMPGYVTDVPSLLRSADVLAQPSLKEGLPIAVLEAMAAGVPVIATRVGDLPEVLDGGAGALVPAGDVTALRDALAVALADETARRAMGAAGAARARLRHDVRVVATRYAEELYRPAITAAGKGAAP
jgi:glycosyltransferase involved in cell wall biosynthesis